MYRIFTVLLVCSVLLVGFAFAQEPRYSTFHEVASIIVDQKLSNNVTAAISLQTTSIQEFRVPPPLHEKIRNNTEIVAVIITNEEQCVLGVQDEVCIMINVKRVPGEGIRNIQQKARTIGDSLIDDINSAFGLQARFHSVFVHYDDAANEALDTTGEVSGTGTISAVYTDSMQSSDFMFNRLAGTLIPQQIRNHGGFYDVAQGLSRDDKSRVTFSILPKEEGSIMQLKVSRDYPNTARGLDEVNPLEFLQVSQIKKSNYYNVGFFPLNSIVHVVILSEDNSTKVRVEKTIEPTIKDGMTVPSDLTKSGWFFNSGAGQLIDAVYLFGQGTTATSNDLKMVLNEKKIQSASSEFNETYILVGIGIAAAVAAGYYLKGIRKKS